MKGGYQIIDLINATAGDSVTIAGVYNTVKGNNGKPVMILTHDGQRVFSQVLEDDGDYLLTYLSGEGKTVKIKIEDTDSVTTTIEDDSASIEALSQGLNEVADKVNGITNSEDTGSLDLLETEVENITNDSNTGRLDVVEQVLDEVYYQENQTLTADTAYTVAQDSYLRINYSTAITTDDLCSVQIGTRTGVYNDLLMHKYPDKSKPAVFVKKGSKIKFNVSGTASHYIVSLVKLGSN